MSRQSGQWLCSQMVFEADTTATVMNMTRYIRIVLCSVLFPSSITAFPARRELAVESSMQVDQQGLAELEQAIADAEVRNDKAFFERLTADDFRYTSATGAIISRKQFLDAFGGPTSPRWDSVTVDNLVVKMLGTSGIVWGRAKRSGRAASGASISATIRFTDVFEKNGDNWQLVASHVSRVD
jgi:ketosteroid isomerase-like protein